MITRIDELHRLAASRRDIIPLAGGLPADELLPRQELVQAMTATMSARAGNQLEALQYGWPEGTEQVRRWIADRLVARGAEVLPDDVIVTAGAQQALSLIASTLPAGTRVAVGSETYPAALQAFTVAGLEVVPDGPAEVSYVVDGVSNPHGVDLVTRQRAALLASGLPMIVDEAYVELRFDGQMPRPLVADAPDRVWHVGTFSKVVSPGLRVGWLVAPRHLRDRLVEGKQAADLQTGSLAQATVARLLAAIDYDDLLDRARNLYAARAEMTIAALRRHAPSWRFAEPEGGFSLWVETDLEANDVDVLEAAIGNGVCVDPGRMFRPGGEVGPLAFRISFSHAPIGSLDTGIRRLAAGARKFRRCDRNIAA